VQELRQLDAKIPPEKCGIMSPKFLQFFTKKFLELFPVFLEKIPPQLLPEVEFMVA